MSQLEILKDLDGILRAALGTRDALRKERRKHGNVLSGLKIKIEKCYATMEETEDRMRSAIERYTNQIEIEESKRKTVMLLLTEAELRVAKRKEELSGLL